MVKSVHFCSRVRMLLSERDKRKMAAKTAAANAPRAVHFKDTRAGLAWGRGTAALWEKAVLASGRRDPLDPKRAGPMWMPSCWHIGPKRFWAMRDNPADIQAISRDFAPIAKARRAREKAERAAAAVKATAKAAVALTWTRWDFERNVYFGQAVEAVFQKPTKDGTFHYFPATVLGAMGHRNGAMKVVRVKWPNPMGGRPSTGRVLMRDVRTPVPNLAGHSLAERQFATDLNGY